MVEDIAGETEESQLERASSTKKLEALKKAFEALKRLDHGERTCTYICPPLISGRDLKLTTSDGNDKVVDHHSTPALKTPAVTQGGVPEEQRSSNGDRVSSCQSPNSNSNLQRRCMLFEPEGLVPMEGSFDDIFTAEYREPTSLNELESWHPDLRVILNNLGKRPRPLSPRLVQYLHGLHTAYHIDRRKLTLRRVHGNTPQVTTQIRNTLAHGIASSGTKLSSISSTPGVRRFLA